MLLLPVGLFAPSIAAAAGLLLDQLPVAASGAYGLRKLRGSHAGPCIRVRRGSDNAEANIGFAGAALDTTALAAFCGASIGYVTRWYDQSGKGNDVAQAVASRQAQIYDGSTVQTENGVPTLVWGNQVGYTASVALSGGTALSCVGVAKLGGGTHYARLVTYTGQGQSQDYDNAPSAALLLQHLMDSAISSYRNGSELAQTVAPSSLFTASCVFDGTNDQIRVNGGPATVAGCIGAFAATGTLTIGNSPDNTSWTGRISEVLLFDLALTADNLNTIQANQKTYFGTA